jgi:hypothetical protein
VVGKEISGEPGVMEVREKEVSEAGGKGHQRGILEEYM